MNTKRKMELDLTKTILPKSKYPELWASDERVQKLSHRMKAPWYKEWYWNVVETYRLVMGRCPLCGSKTWLWGLEREYCTNEKCKHYKEMI